MHTGPGHTASSNPEDEASSAPRGTAHCQEGGPLCRGMSSPRSLLAAHTRRVNDDNFRPGSQGMTKAPRPVRARGLVGGGGSTPSPHAACRCIVSMSDDLCFDGQPFLFGVRGGNTPSPVRPVSNSSLTGEASLSAALNPCHVLSFATMNVALSYATPATKGADLAPRVS